MCLGGNIFLIILGVLLIGSFIAFIIAVYQYEQARNRASKKIDELIRYTYNQGEPVDDLIRFKILHDLWS